MIPLTKLFRVYDLEKKKWVSDSAFISDNGDLYIAKKTLFGTKLELASELRYLAHHSSGYQDCNGVTIMEGDICETKLDGDVVIDKGLVIFSDEFGVFIFLNPSDNTFAILSLELAEFLKVVGNVIDDPDVFPYKEEEVAE